MMILQMFGLKTAKYLNNSKKIISAMKFSFFASACLLLISRDVYRKSQKLTNKFAVSVKVAFPLRMRDKNDIVVP